MLSRVVGTVRISRKSWATSARDFVDSASPMGSGSADSDIRDEPSLGGKSADCVRRTSDDYLDTTSTARSSSSSRPSAIALTVRATDTVG